MLNPRVGWSSLLAFAVLFFSPPFSTCLVAKDKKADVLILASEAVQEVSNKAMPAVVSINSIKDFESRSGKLAFPPGDLDENEGTKERVMGIGSGTIVQSSGIILTSNHVVRNAERITVTLDEKNKSVARVLGTDSKTDLAVIQIRPPSGTKLPTLPFGDSDRMHVGDWVVAVGSPFGLNRSVTSGIVSGLGRGHLGVLDIEEFIQTDAAINPGNSGGPLLNAKGEMIGINTAIFSQSGTFAGVGFAVPSRIAKQVYNDIIAQGRVIRGWAGVSAQDLDPDLARFFSFSSDQGALISQVYPQGPGDHASLKAGDIVSHYGNSKVHSAAELKTLVAKTKIKSRVPIEIYRNGKKQVLEILVRESPSSDWTRLRQKAGQASQGNRTPSPPQLGLTVQNIPPEVAQLLGGILPSGALVVEVKVGSPAFDAGMSVGDIILRANKTEIRNAADFMNFIKVPKSTEPTILYVQKGPDEKIFVSVRTSTY